MKKVTIITRQTKKVGGIEKFIATLARMLADDFLVELIVNYGKPSDKTAFELPNNIQIKFLTPVEPEEISMKALLETGKFAKVPAELARRKAINTEQNKVFRDLLKNLDTDVIITERAMYSFLVKKYYSGQAKLIATDHNFHQNSKKYINELARSVEGFNSLVVPTEELKAYYKNIIDTKTVFIPSALDKMPTKKTKLVAKQIISAGRLVPEKDYLALVKVMKSIHEEDSEIKLCLAGDGPEREMLEREIAKMGLSKTVSMPGFLSQDELEKEYLKSSLFATTSKTEAFGFVIMEAMSYGLPCIAFDSASGARAQISKETGILVPNRDAEKMAKEIVSLINDYPRMLKMQMAIQDKIMPYEMKNVFNKWYRLIDDKD